MLLGRDEQRTYRASTYREMQILRSILSTQNRITALRSATSSIIYTLAAKFPQNIVKGKSALLVIEFGTCFHCSTTSNISGFPICFKGSKNPFSVSTVSCGAWKFPGASRALRQQRNSRRRCIPAIREHTVFQASGSSAPPR